MRPMTQIRQEVRTLASKYDGMLMYPGRWLFTWIKAPHMPWVLASIEPEPVQ
jgi:hypothetical protein